MFTPLADTLRSRTGFDNGGPTDIPVVSFCEIAQPQCFVRKIEVINMTDQPIMFSVYDGAGIPIIPRRAAPVGEIITYSAIDGRRVTGGIWWKADSEGCKGYVSGFLL